MTSVSMRTSTTLSTFTKSLVRRTPKTWRAIQPAIILASPRRHLAQVRPEPLHELWFTSNTPRKAPNGTDPNSILPDQPTPSQNGDHEPPSERMVQLGRTLRTLSPLLPNILTTPLPQSILAPSITLHLFPSTHPHLPIVKGKVAYRAALFTAPVAWGSVPFVNKCKLQIISEKIVRTGYDMCTPSTDIGEEKLVVRFKTDAPTSTDTASSASSATNTNPGLSTLLGGQSPVLPSNGGNNKPRAFSGLFIFTFDDKGRIASHTIEHADEDSGYDRTSKVVTLTDWLLGKAKGRKAEEDLLPGLGVAIARTDYRRGGILAQVVRLAREERSRRH